MRHLGLLFVAAVVGLAGAAEAATVQELARLKGQGQSILRGVGLVTGLNGTGDSGKELAMARPLAQVLANSGNALASPRELLSGKSVALVMVTCVVPEAGGRADDTFDISVTVINSATSLRGGELYLAPMRGPFPNSPVYGIGAGLVDLNDPSTPTAGRVRGGARLVRDILMPEVGDQFDLILAPAYAGWSAASQIATAINARAQPQGPSVAFAIDDRTIRVTIPASERADRAGFLADVMSADVNASLLDLPAQVIVNPRTGSIIVTGDVEISPVAITQKDLNITTTIPAPVGTAINPLVRRDRWTTLETAMKPAEGAKLSDLIAAFKQLDIPVAEQINILQMLHKTGKLQARLVID